MPLSEGDSPASRPAAEAFDSSLRSWLLHQAASICVRTSSRGSLPALGDCNSTYHLALGEPKRLSAWYQRLRPGLLTSSRGFSICTSSSSMLSAR